MKFAEGLELGPEHATSLGWGEDLINATLEFVQHMKEITLDNSEFSLLCAIVLTFPGV